MILHIVVRQVLMNRFESTEVCHCAYSIRQVDDRFSWAPHYIANFHGLPTVSNASFD